MTVKGILKAIKNPIRFQKRYREKKEAEKKEAEEDFNLFKKNLPLIEIKDTDIDKIDTTIIKLISQTIPIYRFSEPEKYFYYEYGIENTKLPIFLILMNKLANNPSIILTIKVNSKKYRIDKNTPIQIYRYLKNKKNFIVEVESPTTETFALLFQVADLVNDEQTLVFRANVLYKKQTIYPLPNNGLIDLQKLHKHNHPSLINWDEPVDIVYTWVNGNDPTWRKKILNYKSKNEIDFDRFEETNELQYSLRSVEKHMPWVRNIYIVTNCQIPDWINTNNTKIYWVWHDDLFPSDAQYLPTFNSHSIESCLHRIKGLSEHFIYFNDDVFVMKDLKKSSFFKSNGCSISFMEPYGMAFYSRSGENEGYIDAALNGKKLLEDTFNISPVQFHRHTPHALRKSILEEMETLFSNSYHTVRLNRFRDKSDISATSFLYHHYSFIKKESVREGCREHLIRNKNYKSKTRASKQSTPHFICINDGAGSHQDTKFKIWMNSFLETYFPKPASWENYD
jgi:hypothetical protein